MDVDAQCTRVGNSSFAIEYNVQVAGVTVCRVETTYVYADSTGTPVPVPDDVRVLLSS